jgi:hypothetical protein
MDPSSSDSPHSFPQSELHHEDQIQRVVSPANQASMAHFQTQYGTYEPYHHRTELDGNIQHDARQQVRTTPD